MFATDAIDDRIVKTIEHTDGTSTHYLAIIAPDFDPGNPLKEWDMAISFYVPAWGDGHSRMSQKYIRELLDADDFPFDTDRLSRKLADQTVDQSWYESTNASAWLQAFRALDPSGIAFIVDIVDDRNGYTLTIADDDDESSREFAIAYRSTASIREDFGVKRITQRIRQRAVEGLKNELKTINAYFAGEVYGWQLLRQEIDAEGETIESTEVGGVWGYYGSGEWEYMYSEALAAAEIDATHQEKARTEAWEAWRALDTPDVTATYPNNLTASQYYAVADCLARIQ